MKASEYGQLSNNTRILVRGASYNWRSKTYGRKEAQVANMIRDGKDVAVVNATDFYDLMCHRRSMEPRTTVAGVPVARLMGESSNLGPFPYGGSFRDEQKALRDAVLGRTRSRPCALCGRILPANYLVAAHIKARASLTQAERSDLENVGMPLCVLGCHYMYDAGLLSVDATGRILVSSQLRRVESLRATVSAYRNRRCSAHSPSSEKYFAWHRHKTFASDGA
jgi:hypothetical protein